MKPTNNYSFYSQNNVEELQTREEYTQKTREMIISETKDLAAKIKGSSLKEEEKQTLLKDSITILLNNL